MGGEGTRITDSDRLAQIAARAEAATAGPWVVDGRGVTARGYVTSHDWVFIAHAREDVPWLLALVERLTAELAQRDEQIAALRDELADAYAEGANIGAVIGAHHARAAARSDDGGRS